MSTCNTFARKILLFLVDGKSTGLRRAAIRGWQQAQAAKQEAAE